MTQLSPKARVLFQAANHAAFDGFTTPGKIKGTAIHEWLCAEAMFADAVGIGFIIQPKEAPQEEWQCKLFQAVALALNQIRHQQFGDAYRTDV